MSRRAPFPLMARMLLWLLVHLAVLAGAFVVFVGWQLQLGLDSLLSGASGERLKTLGAVVSAELRTAKRAEWDQIIAARTSAYGVEAAVLLQDGRQMHGADLQLPSDIGELVQDFDVRRDGVPDRPRMGGPGQRPPFDHDGPRPRDRPEGPPSRRPRDGEGPGFGGPRQPEPSKGSPEPRPVFLTRSAEEGGYWAGIDLPLFRPGIDRPLHGMLILRSSNPSAAGLFFDLRPWILGGLAVLGLSLLLWAPFVIGITRYASRLSRATEQIARGRFDVRVGGGRHDELGSVGRSIERMADRLKELLQGQKRFLGDVAHELCSPLARIRTGLGILEHRLGSEEQERLASIEEDVSELSDLVAEVLAFTRAETAPESIKSELLELAPLVLDAAGRECPDHLLEIDMPAGLAIRADRRLLGRAIANILRNAHRHGGGDCQLLARGRLVGDSVHFSIEDGGKGVSPDEATKLFDPFYRPDGARTRESGGVGLGLAIVRSGIEACGGSVQADRSELGGLAVRVTLPGA